MACVLEALQLEDTIKNYERCSSTGWYASSDIFPLLQYSFIGQNFILVQKANSVFNISHGPKFIFNSNKFVSFENDPNKS